MFPWTRRSGHGAAAAPAAVAPAAAPAVAAPAQFQATPIWVVASNHFTGDYQLEVLNHLINIESLFPLLFTKLTQAGKRIGISYNGTGANQINGNTDGSYIIRDMHALVLGGHRQAAQFGQTLQTEISSNHLTVASLVTAMMATALPSWSGGTSPHPFQGMGTAAVTTRVNDWIAGRVLPTHEEMDLLVMDTCLPDPARGSGCNVAIKYDPRYNVGRPAIVGLFHELVHAYYLTKGANPGIVESSAENAGGRHFELMAVGMSPYQNRRFSENKFRALVGAAARTVYP